MKNLPNKFLDKMRTLLSSEDYKQLIADYEKVPYRGIRVNTLKCNADKVKKFLPFASKQTPFCQKGLYIPHDTKNIGDEPFHRAGAFYVQEPSASSAVTVLNVQEGDRVLDLCAAPGGKSTHIAADLNRSGLLWSNEIVKNRASILLSNIERMGISNSVVSNCHPDVLCSALKGYFDKVLVDAPCSGEGMFRKDDKAIEEWSMQHSISCGERQLSILNSAAKALKDGGIIVYSTCTFSVEENEKVIARFLENNRDFELVDSGVSFGHRAMEKAVRILPSDGGEGHFVAKLKKSGVHCQDTAGFKTTADIFPEKNTALELYDGIFKTRVFGESFTKIGDKIILMPNIDLPPLNGLGVIRAGILFGEIKKSRVEPCHSLFMAALKNDLRNYVDLKYNDPRLEKFYHGEEIEVDNTLKGFTTVLVEGISTGFGKASGGILKNRYPKGLRKLG